MSRSVVTLRMCVVAAGLVLLAGCGAEIVHIGNHGLSPNGPFAPPAGSGAVRPSAQPSASANGVIHFITSGGGSVVAAPSNAFQAPLPAPAVPDADVCRGTSVSFASDIMLSPEDVWPDQPGGTQGGVAVQFPTGCAFDLPAVPLFDCTIGFPWFSASDMSYALANIGVVRLDIDTLVYGQQSVTEYVLRLSGYAATDLTHMATTCDEHQSALDAMHWTFRARTSQGVTTSLLRVNDNFAIAVVFHGLPEDAKDPLLNLASARAGQP